MPEPYRVVVCGRPAPVARHVAAVQQALPATAAGAALAELPEAIARLRPDVVLLDESSLEAIDVVRRIQPATPIALVAALPTLEGALAAMRAGANDLVPDPMDEAAVARIRALADGYRSGMSAARRSQRVLAIGAHPDDVEFGVGGILAAHRSAGDEVTILTLSRGRREGGVELAWSEASASAAVIGARLVFEEQPMSFSPLLAAVGRQIEQVQPTIVYTHSKHDRRQDHRVVHEATVAAGEEVPTVACYQGTTGTTSFKPTRFVPVDAVIETKLEMLARFASRGGRPAYLAPDFALATARYWSQYGHGGHCEPLEIIRESVASPVAPALAGVAEHAHTGELAVLA